MKASDLVMLSYGRCCVSPSFFDDFYQYFLASSPIIHSKFSNTNMAAQKLLLRQGILNVVLHARGMPDTKLRALGCSHAKKGFDIQPELYDLWLEALLKAISKHDSQVSPEALQGWREVLHKGIAVITSHYHD